MYISNYKLLYANKLTGSKYNMQSMKKVKITILKTTLDEELAKEYGVDGLSSCPLMNEGQVFYADYAKPKDFVMKHGRPFINMCLH